jgi:AhpD family alkylhydroperoxidase
VTVASGQPGQGRSRLADIPYEQWDFEALAEISPGMKPPDLSVVAFFAHHPELAEKFLVWNHFMNSKACRLDRRTREMAILRVAIRKRSRYEWAQHIKSARRAGIADEEIAAIASGTAAGLAGLLARAVDELTDESALSDGTYAGLAAHFTERQLISLVFLIGTYSLLSTVFGAFRLELDPGLDAEDFDAYVSNHEKKGNLQWRISLSPRRGAGRSTGRRSPPRRLTTATPLTPPTTSLSARRSSRRPG